MTDSDSGEERAVFKALLFSGDTSCRAWNLMYRVLIQLKFVSDGSCVKLLGIHEQKDSYVYELSLQTRVSVKMKSDFVQWHVSQSDCVQSVGARFLTPTEADKFHSCFQQLLQDVSSRQQKIDRQSMESQPAVLIPHPSVRPSSALQLTVSLPDGRRRTESVNHSTRLRDVLSRVCQAEQLSHKYHYLKLDKLRLDPEPGPLDMDLTVGEVKVSKLLLVDRRESTGKSHLSFLKGREEKERDGQVTLLNGTFKSFQTEPLADVAPRQTVQFLSPARLSADRATGERVESPIDSVDELELAAPFRDVFRQEMPKRSSSLRSRVEEESPEKAAADKFAAERPNSLNRTTFSESDIREAFSQSDHRARPSTPSRRRAPKPPRAKLSEQTEICRTELMQERSKKSSQVPLFKVPQEVTSQLQDEFSQRLSALRAKSAEQDAPLEPLASSTPDKKSIKVKPQIAPKPSHLSRVKQTDFPLYPSTPPSEDLLTSSQGTCRGVRGRVDIWKAREEQQQQLVFRPHNSGLFESEALVFNLPGPPTDSPPPTPPPPSYAPDCDSVSEPIETESLIPPPQEDFYQSDLMPSSPPSPQIHKKEFTDEIQVTDIDQSIDSDAAAEDLIVLPPPHFSALSDADFVDFPPPSPLQLSMSPDCDLSLGDPPSPTAEPVATSLVTELNNRNVVPQGTELNMKRVTELLTAAADTLNTDGTQASELVRAALELIAADSQKSEPEFLIKSSYDNTNELRQREAPNFATFGEEFNACMQDIRTDIATNLKPATKEVLENHQNSSEVARDDVVSAVAKVMKERRQQMEHTNSLSDPSHSSLADDWK